MSLGTGALVVGASVDATSTVFVQLVTNIKTTPTREPTLVASENHTRPSDRLTTLSKQTDCFEGQSRIVKKPHGTDVLRGVLVGETRQAGVKNLPHALLPSNSEELQ